MIFLQKNVLRSKIGTITNFGRAFGESVRRIIANLHKPQKGPGFHIYFTLDIRGKSHYNEEAFGV